MPRPRDREPTILEQRDPAFPLPPLNMSVSSGFRRGFIDIRWTSPAEISVNTCFDLRGVNIYRSFDSEFGPWFRINALPIGATFWRDRVREAVAVREDVTAAFNNRGAADDPDGRWSFCVKNRPIIIQAPLGAPDCTELNVQVTVNGVPAKVREIVAEDGIVYLETRGTFDVTSQQLTPPVLPEDPEDVVHATYRYLKRPLPTDLARRIFYRITTVAADPETGALIETPLARAQRSNNLEVERLDWIWQEAVRRNAWILDQGGERVKAFIRRSVGVRCGCSSDLHKQAKSDCQVCYGTRVIGGYDGPYDVIVAPDDSPKKISQTNRGRMVEHVQDVWTGPSPLLSQRDFIVKLNGDRYAVGPVRMPSNRGMQLQQHFSISRLDEGNIIYDVPIPDPRYLVAPRTRYVVPGEGAATPMVSEKSTIGDERELRGNTVTYENHNY